MKRKRKNIAGKKSNFSSPKRNAAPDRRAVDLGPSRDLARLWSMIHRTRGGLGDARIAGQSQSERRVPAKNAASSMSRHRIRTYPDRTSGLRRMRTQCASPIVGESVFEYGPRVGWLCRLLAVFFASLDIKVSDSAGVVRGLQRVP